MNILLVMGNNLEISISKGVVSVKNKKFHNGFVLLSLGFAALSVSFFLEIFTIFGDGTDFARGFFDGLAVVAFGVAIFVLVRSKRKQQA
jgi:hypothetical protein